MLTRDDISPRDRIRKLSSRPVVDVAPARAYAREQKQRMAELIVVVAMARELGCS
ncbi:hypothetical protein ACWC9H_00405 [Streptomyces sp. NPDC001251]